MYSHIIASTERTAASLPRTTEGKIEIFRYLGKHSRSFAIPLTDVRSNKEPAVFAIPSYIGGIHEAWKATDCCYVEGRLATSFTHVNLSGFIKEYPEGAHVKIIKTDAYSAINWDYLFINGLKIDEGSLVIED